MTILKDELKVKPDEPAVEYAERVESVLERHRLSTGERFKPTDDMPGETPRENLERFKKLDEAFNIKQAERELRAAERERAQAKPSNTSSSANKDTSATAEKSSRSFRLKSQERDIQRAGTVFEDAEKKLYRMDGSTKLYGDEEHAERIGKLRQEFAQAISKVVAEAETDAKGYEKEALAFSYTDPASQVSASERGKLETSRVFVKEDCEDMSVPALSERISAVSAGSDKVAKVLHARYGRRRLEALNAESNRLAREGRPSGPEAAREIRTLAEAVAALEGEIKDPKTEERRQAVEEAAKASWQLVSGARGRQSEVDGTAARSRERQAEMLRGAF